MATNPTTIEAEPAPQPVSAAEAMYADDLPNPNPEGGDLSVDAEGRPRDERGRFAPVQEGDPEPQEGGNAEPEPGEGDPQPEPTPAVEAPHSWSAEDREVFAKLDPAAQQVVLRRERERDLHVKRKENEVVQTRQRVETAARQVLTTYQQQQITQLEAFSRMVMPEAPDTRLLMTGQESDRALFYHQEARARVAQDQYQQIHQALQQAREAASAMETAEQAAQRQQDEAVLSEKLGDTWSDPSKRQQFFTDLEPVGRELGYPPERLALADATDLLALQKYREATVKAAKWDALEKARTTTVPKVRQLPKVTQPGVAGGARREAPKSVASILYPDD